MNAKKAVGNAAAQEVRQGMVVGLGTGSTATWFVQALAERVHREKLAITCVASSLAASHQAWELGLPLVPLEHVDVIDLYADGADEVAPDKNLIKGRGAAMLQEKILAAASQRFLVLVDESKLVARLGSSFPIPVEVLPIAKASALRHLHKLGGKCEVRQATRKDGPVVTDQGNLVIDMHLKLEGDAQDLSTALNAIPGVLGHGLFVGLAPEVLVGEAGGNVRKW